MADQNMAYTESNKGAFFYFLMCLAAFLIILLPVGIANLYFGYVLLDSPCTLCWGQRIAMMFIGVTAFFIVRYGAKPRYLATLLIFAACGLFLSFRHLSNHAGRDLDQGFGLMVFGLHTYSWAEITFWAVIILLGVMLFFAPKYLGAAATEGKTFRQMNGFAKFCYSVSALILFSNLIQAAISTGLPPNYGQGDPVRFSLNPKEIIHTDAGMKGHFNTVNFLGKRDVKSPDYAFDGNARNLGITFDHDASHSPIKVDSMLSIASEKSIPVSQPVNTLNLIDGQYVVSSKFDVWYLNPTSLKVEEHFEFDPLFSATIDPTVGLIPYKDGYLLMGSNKSLMKFKKSKTDTPEKEIIGRYSDFVKGGNDFFATGRGRIDTIRARFHHIMSVASDDKHSYTATVPNNRDKKSFVISRQLLKDMVTDGEFTPAAKLLEGRSLGELYVTGMCVFNGKLYALSKNFNVILKIDPKAETVEGVYGIPASLTDPRGLVVTEDSFQIVDHNKLVTLK